MKAKLLQGLVLTVLLFAILMIPVNTYAAAPVGYSTNSEIALAKQAGQNWIQNISGRPDFEKWSGAELTNPQILYDINGKPNAFLFSVMSSNFTGHMIVGNSKYEFAIFEAGEAAPPIVPDANVAKLTINNELNLGITKISNPKKLLYLGFQNIYAEFDLTDDVGLNLYSNNAVLVSKLKSLLPTPQEYFARQKSTEAAKPQSFSIMYIYGYGCLSMTAYTGWCGPASAVSIGRYYRDYKGYSRLPTDSTMYSQLFINGGITYNQDYGPTFVAMTHTAPASYTNFSYANDWIPTGGDYWNRVSDINNGWPIAVAASQFYDDLGGNPSFPPNGAHWVAMKGYEYPSHGVNHAIICTDSYSGDSNLWLNWDHLTSGLMFTCTIKN